MSFTTHAKVSQCSPVLLPLGTRFMIFWWAVRISECNSCHGAPVSSRHDTNNPVWPWDSAHQSIAVLDRKTCECCRPRAVAQRRLPNIKKSMAIITSFSKHVALSLNVKDQRSTNLPMRWNSHVQHNKSTKWNANIPAWTANQSSCAVWFMGFARCVFVRHHVRMRPVSQEQYHNLTCTKHAYLWYTDTCNLKWCIYIAYEWKYKTISCPYTVYLLHAKCKPTY